MGKFGVFLCTLTIVSSMPWPALAAEGDEARLQNLERELQDLKQGLEAHDRVLRVLIERFKQQPGGKPQAAPRPEAQGERQGPSVNQNNAEENQQVPAPPTPKSQPEPQVVPPAMAVPPALKKQRKPASTPTQSAEQTRPEKLGKPGASRGQEVIRQEVNVLLSKRLVIEPGFSFSRTDRQQVSLSGFLALDAIFLGSINVDEVESNLLTFDLATRYGLTDRLEIDLGLPFLYRDTTYRDTGAGSEEQSGEADVSLDFRLGDISLGTSYQVLRESPPWPDIVWNMRLKTPTGSHPFGVKTVKKDNLAFPEELSSGNGVWAISTGLSFVKSVAPAILFGNISYFHNIEQSFDDISSDRNTVQPGSIKLGNLIQMGVGFAVAISEKMSFSIAYSQLFSEKTETKPDGGKKSKIKGSDTTSAQLNFGVTFALSDHWSLVSNVAAGLTPDAPNVQVSMKFPYSF